MTSIQAIHPAAAAPKVSSNLDSALSANWFGASLPTSFASALSTASAGAQTSTATANPQAALQTLLAQGVPVSSIVAQLSQNVIASLNAQFGFSMSQAQLTSLEQRIKTALAGALDPPSNGPPATAAQQASALAQRLDGVLETLAGSTIGGQQNELSGSILDAISAKESPAQQTKSNLPATSAKVSSLAQSLLAQTIAQLQTASPATTVSVAPLTAAQPAAALPSATPSTTTQTSTSSVPVLTMSNAPDLLARMLVRAASADPGANATASSVVSSANVANDAPTPTSAWTQALAAQFVTALSDGSDTSSQNGNASSNPFGSQTADASNTTPSSNASSNTDANNAFAVFAMQQPIATSAAVHATPAAPAIDADTVIEQMVKSMTLRSQNDGSSTINLRLQPENLGDVSMKITVTGSQISATVIAQSVDVRNTLVAHQQQLAKSLADAGLTLGGFSVDVSGGNTGRDGNRDATQGFGRRYVVHEVGQTTETEAPTAGSGPPLISGAGLELFNYLA